MNSEVGGMLFCCAVSLAAVGGVVALVIHLTKRRGGPSLPGGWQVIVSAYRGTCPMCMRIIVPGTHILWQRGQKARHADCAAVKAEAEDELVAAALDKIRDAKGPASRANALQLALGRLVDPIKRQRLLLEASRLAVQATLDKVDTLKSVRAKRRHLEEAHAAVTSDELPDELQAEELAWLVDAMKQLDEE